ncbi:tetratricopeptide repeat protein [Oxalobacteraceae bacterium OTU3CINTB1]|nr:tetratricopeptide repeat protein [Oxalobacteraceae bacterium OTU3CINTB1]
MSTSSNVDQLFAQGVQLHSEGNLPQALQVYEQVLRLAPQHFDALHHTGIAAFQNGNFEMAASFIRSALAVDAGHAAAQNNLGNALRELQLLEDALRCYDKALALDADDAHTHFNRAVTLQSLMRVDEALQGYDQALALDAGDDQAWNNRALLLWQTKQYELAQINVEQALAINPDNIEAHNNLGNILQDLGQPDGAEQSYRQALAMLPDYADAHYNLGRLLLAAGRDAEALACHEQAIALHPQFLQAQRQRAQALRRLDRTDEAGHAETQVLALQAGLVAAYRKRAGELEQLRQHESAAALYASALEFDPEDDTLRRDHARALGNSRQQEQVLTSLRQALELKMERAALHGAREVLENTDQDRDYESARIAFEKLTKLAPSNPRAYINLGSILQKLGLDDLAMENYDRALAVAPNSPLGNWNRALMLLARGDYERGWAAYEWRWKTPELPLYKHKRHFLKPQWSGREPLQGKTILLHAEQGFGDSLQFCRYAALAKQRGARVVLEVPKTLVPLMGTLAGVDQIVAAGSSLPAFDFHIPLMSLPFAFKTRVDTIPSAPSYLSSDAAKREQWNAVLGPKTKLRVGLVWSGSATHGNDHNRTLPLSVLAKALSDRYEFICLQKEIRADDQPLLATLPVRQVSELLLDFGDTAALCDVMDVVITVDTSVAHLAGALGKRVWILLPTPFEWRWLQEGATSPWYPTATLYRQERIGAWEPVIAAVAADLAREAANGVAGVDGCE